ncbi:hypothetical protein SAMN05518801_1213 [Novosphingobium sp. CF614]|uniref:hypothetical protein n=1 Tax=Novosphingobium sp. CF614 TaxID=1884364 RepID=UPI0008DFE67C|nr:hypothetical protein [Novosphingobium sp. CF614]SFG38182.1 hypothetical protein SAMN05518801_1213 [Novosphingobium sp. CF614]
MAKLNRDEILRGLLQTLVDGWGKGAILEALEALDTATPGDKHRRDKHSVEDRFRGVEALVAEMEMSPEHRRLMTDLARRFDDGRAFPRIGDVRGFLLSHQQNATDLKGRTQGFRRMLPILTRMSPKGLERLIARSHHSGPADLGEISDAIRGAGEDLRGKPQARAETVEPVDTQEVNTPAENAEPNANSSVAPEQGAVPQSNRTKRRRGQGYDIKGAKRS